MTHLSIDFVDVRSGYEEHVGTTYTDTCEEAGTKVLSRAMDHPQFTRIPMAQFFEIVATVNRMTGADTTAVSRITGVAEDRIKMMANEINPETPHEIEIDPDTKIRINLYTGEVEV